MNAGPAQGVGVSPRLGRHLNCTLVRERHFQNTNNNLLLRAQGGKI